MVGVMLSRQMAQDRRAETRELFQVYGPMVYRRAFSLMGSKSDAEDAVQDVFVKAFSNLDAFRGESRPSTWLFRITTNHCLNVIRNSKRQRELLEEHHDREPRRSAESADERLFVVTLLAAAQPDQAAAAVCIYLDGMTRHETAEVLGVSTRTVGNLLTRFSSWARDTLSEQDLGRVTGLDAIEDAYG